MATAIEAFMIDLKKDSPFCEDLVMTPCKRMDEVRSRTLRFIRLEEDMKFRRGPTLQTHTKILIGRSIPQPKDPINQNRTPNLIIIGLMPFIMKGIKMNSPRSLTIVFYGCFRSNLYYAGSW